MDQRKLVSKLNKAATKISNAGVYGSGNFLITNNKLSEYSHYISQAFRMLAIREIRIDKIKKILKDE